VLPGHALIVKTGDRRLKTKGFRYYDVFADPFQASTPNTQHPTPKDRREAVTQLRSVLEDSIRPHLISDVPVAAFLSGGIDSSAIVALMSRVADQKPKTFTVVFNEKQFSEAEHARAVARKFGTDHKEILLSEKALLDLLPAALQAMDQPTMDGVNTYVVSKAIRDAGIKVALSGLGGDELFAGYPSFRRATQLAQLTNAPTAIRHLASSAGRALLNGSSRRTKFWDMVASDCTPYAAYVLSRQLFSPAEIASLLARGQKSEFGDVSHQFRAENLIPNTEDLNGNVINAVSRLRSSVTSSRNIINEVSRLELSGYMSNTLLRDTDQMSMAHGLEVRVPFIDRDIVNYVMGLPGDWKMNGGRPKPLLIDAVADLLPEEIWRRPKMGFTLPFERWMRSALQAELDETFSRADAEQLGIDTDYTKSVWDGFKRSPQHQPWSRPWALYVLAKWCEINRVAI
jgi:asparagine synthase (glutamine-hydrolysing)